MRKKNGFTLMELLAVIVILAIIALIVYPIVGNVINDSKKKTFERSVEGLERAAELDYQKDSYTGVREYKYENGEFTLLTVKGQTKNTSIKVEGLIEDGVGTVSVDEDGNTSLVVYNKDWCATKGVNDKTVTVEEKTEDNCVIPVMVTDFTLSNTNVELDGNTTETIGVTFEPENATNTQLNWVSSDESIVTVDENGVLTSVSNGTATITVSTTDGSNISKTISVTVINLAYTN